VSPLSIPGQPLAERILSASADRPSPPQQLLLHGPVGAGKRRAARAFAWAIVDPGATHDPSDESIDIDTARASGTVLLMDEQLESQLLALSAKPAVGARRVLIIDGAEDLKDKTGASRILKILEEPPPLSHIILITDHPSDLMPTIRSRCMPVPFRSPGWQVIADELQRRGDDPVDARARARADGLLALQIGPFERRLRTLGGQLGIAALESAGGGPDLVHDIQAAMDAAAADHPSEELLSLRAAADELEGKRGGKTAAKKAEDQQKRERRRLVTDGWKHVLDGMTAVLADALAVATGSEASVRHAELLDRLRAVAHPERRVEVERCLGDVQRARAGLTLNPMVDLWMEGLIDRMAMVRRGSEPPAPAPGRLAA
jgi:DNA polymerase-3 subunit delta'